MQSAQMPSAESTQKFSLPWGQPLQSAQWCFSLPAPSPRSGVSACHAGRGCSPRSSLQLAMRAGGLQSAQSFSLPCGQGLQSTQKYFSLPWGQPLQSAQWCFSLLGAALAVRAVVFQLAMRAGVAVRAVLLQLAMRAGLAVRAAVFRLPCGHGSQSAQKYFSLPCAHLFLFFPMLASPFRAPPSAAEAPSLRSSGRRCFFGPSESGREVAVFSWPGTPRRVVQCRSRERSDAHVSPPPHTLEIMASTATAKSTDVASFIAANVSPVDGDLSSELSGPTEKTRRLWSACQDALRLEYERGGCRRRRLQGVRHHVARARVHRHGATRRRRRGGRHADRGTARSRGEALGGARLTRRARASAARATRR